MQTLREVKRRSLFINIVSLGTCPICLKLRHHFRGRGSVGPVPTGRVANRPLLLDSIDPKSLPGIVLDDTNAKLHRQLGPRSSNFTPHIGRGYVFSGERALDKSKGDGKVRPRPFDLHEHPSPVAIQLLIAYSWLTKPERRMFPSLYRVGISAAKSFVIDQTVSLPNGKLFRPIDNGGSGCGHRDGHSDHQLQHRRVCDS